MTSIKFRLAAYTDSAGKSNPLAPRNGNEDNMYVKSDLSVKDAEYLFKADKEEVLSGAGCLLAVADGMGGMNAGEVASEIAISVIRDRFEDVATVTNASKDPKSRASFMESVIIDADSAIKTHARTNKGCDGMGSTAILAWICGDEVTVSWCGDSRAYLFRESDGLKQISKDHSYVQELVDAGKITMDEAFDHPFGNVITRSLGDSSQKARPESITVRLQKGDLILVNSDGLSGVLRDNEMEQIIRDNRNDMGSCRAALWTAAEAADWYDNVTAILCEILDMEGTVIAAPVEPTTKTNEETSNIRTNSFFNFRIKKKTLLAICAALVLALVAIGAFCLGLSKHDDDTSEGDTTEMESLVEDSNIENISIVEPCETIASPVKSQKSVPENTVLDKIKSKLSKHEENADTTQGPVVTSAETERTVESRLTPVSNDSIATPERPDTTQTL